MKTKPFVIAKRQVLQAYELVKANAGSAGLDQQSLSDYAVNLEDNLYKLWNRLSSGSYFPPAVKAVAIPKKAGGERILGIPTVSDRIAQMVVKLELEPQLEPHFLPDSYGYRPNKSALDAIGVTRERCWRYDWVLEFDIKGLFDHIPHDLLLKAVDKHTDNPWVRLYIGRWLTAPMVLPDGEQVERTMGTPQGGVISPLLANLYLHYVFDLWLSKHYPAIPWCRYADDGLLHCRTKAEAEQLLAVLDARFQSCGLTLHPEKTKIVYCKDVRRQGDAEQVAFDFLGYTFRQRYCASRDQRRLFMGFNPAISKVSLKSIRLKIKQLRLPCCTSLSLEALAGWLNPMIVGWFNYYGRYHRSALYAISRYINQILVKWARRKYKTLRQHKTRAVQFLEEIARQSPGLFAHWRMGMTGAFV